MKVNETVLQLGTDYTVDYQTGELDFTPVGALPRIISSTDVITASYESSGLGNNSGTLMGLRAEEPFMKGKGLVGVTWLQQNTPMAGQGDTAAYQEDDYQGSGTTGPFDTNYRPILANGATATINGVTEVVANPLVVLVDGTQQVEGVNYDDYRQIGRIIFRQAGPPTSLVRSSITTAWGRRWGRRSLRSWGWIYRTSLTPSWRCCRNTRTARAGRGRGDGHVQPAHLHRPEFQRDDRAAADAADL